MIGDVDKRTLWFKTRNVYIFMVLLTIPIIYFYSVMNKSMGIRNKIDFIEGLMSVINESNDRADTTPTRLKNKVGEMTLLAWTPFFSNWSWFAVDSCPLIKRGLCRVTTDRNQLEKADAVLFHWRDINPNDLPLHKKKDQIWILLNFESPMNTPKYRVTHLDMLIDATLTYRMDSDIYIPYGRIKSRQKGASSYQAPPLIETLTKEEFQNKSLITWLVSNCDTPSNRRLYARDLQRTVFVDIYGSCTKRWTSLCDKDFKRDTCYANLSKKYKFYLSFENSLCKDYVTEKFYLPLLYGMVPVVLGGADYDKFAPKDSYINALDFQSAKHLGDYLKQVATNFTLYQRYLNWTKYYYVNPNYDLNESTCEACSYLIRKLTSDDSNSDKKYPHLIKWWYEQESCWKWDPDSKSGKTFYTF